MKSILLKASDEGSTELKHVGLLRLHVFKAFPWIIKGVLNARQSASDPFLESLAIYDAMQGRERISENVFCNLKLNYLSYNERVGVLGGGG